MNALRAFSLLAVVTGGLTCLGQEPDWWRAEGDLAKWLWASNTPIARLVSRVSHGSGADGQAILFKIAVFLRAGMDQQAAESVSELKRACPKLGHDQISSIYYAACEDEAWHLAQMLAETFEESVADVTLEDRLLKHWLESGRTIEQIDGWLAARPGHLQPFWVKERLRFAQSHGRGDSLRQSLGDAVRRNPGDLTNAIVFLDALLSAGSDAQPIDLSWFLDRVKPVRALDAKALAERLKQLEQWQAALHYFQHAITIPLTDPELEELSKMRQVFISEERTRAEVAVAAREAMAECLLKLDQADAAQERMVEAADLRKQYGLLPNALLAGRVQSASGQATIERRITAAASASEDDAAYWSERAQYYRGRKEPDREEEALKQALSLTRPQPTPERRDKGYTDSRRRVLSDYVQFLSRQKRGDEAVRLLRQELADAPALAESSARAAYLLAFHFDKQLKADDPVLWNWLASRPVWGHPEERLLWRMLENAAIEAHAAPTPTRPPTQAWRMPEKIAQDLEQHFRRAEKLAGNGHFSRAYTLGWIMNRLQFPQRSIPLLERATATATDDEARQRASFALLESLLDTGAWQEAEVIFDRAAQQLTAREIPQWHSRLALAAAREGHKADALRLWFRTANVSPMALRGLDELARLGLRDDLLAFYRAMQKEMPASQAPVRALELLMAK